MPFPGPPPFHVRLIEAIGSHQIWTKWLYDLYRQVLYIQPITATTAELADITDDINTLDKYTGKSVFNTTTGSPVWAGGDTAAAVWVNATGATAHTPV